ncbi:hypothetical protein QR680_009598 [Steinernema hermaphroditum]|uniref:RNA-binding motif protein 22 n=1 Tax=Steinernema hermaphroditum TaxID=289476 RepID=A0AA39MA72_9BILA|nr:hypothetical protein QR680_009598 [Steinernema hermaphroditum]
MSMSKSSYTYNRKNWEDSDFPILCETCLGNNPYLRMMKDKHGAECKICNRPFTNFRWMPGKGMRYKKTEVCQTCSKLKNVCQTCLLDLEFGLPVQVRDYALKVNADMPKMGANRDFYVQNAERQLADTDGTTPGGALATIKPDEAATEMLRKLARTQPYYNRNRAHICSFFVKGECKRGEECPYRHEKPTDPDDPLSQQNMKDRYYGTNDPVAEKLLNRAKAAPTLSPPEDPTITTLYVGNLGESGFINEIDLRDVFYQYGEIRNLTILAHKGCAFVQFTHRQASEMAAERSFNRLVIKGRKMTIRWGRPQSHNTNVVLPEEKTFRNVPSLPNPCPAPNFFGADEPTSSKRARLDLPLPPMPPAKVGVPMHAGQESKKTEKKYKVYYSLNKEDLSSQLDKKKSKGKDGKESKKKDTNAPGPERVPLPPLTEAMKAEKRQAQKDLLRRTKINAETPPNICMYTVANASGGVTCVDVTEDSSLIAIGYGSSAIQIKAVGETSLYPLKSMDDLDNVDQEADDILNEMYDKTQDVKNLLLQGHQSTVYSVSFSPDKRLLLSSSLDSTIRLWTIAQRKNVVVYRLNSPVCSDGTAMVWATDRMQPLRVLTGALSDVSCIDYHPNCNYVVGGSDDRCVRLWDVSTGSCVRTFAGHKGSVRGVKISPCGRYIVSVSEEGSLIVWDIALQKMVTYQDTPPFPYMASLCFSRDGGTIVASTPHSAVSLYSLEALLASNTGQGHASNETKVNYPGFSLYTYPTKNTPLIGRQVMRMSYLEGLSPEVEIAEGALVDNKARFADLKMMLDSNKDKDKMDAMKRIINMVAKGKDAAELFPAVVKNVAAKNLELKKLVFVYLVRYAEEQQDLALLSISTFQRALKDPNQLIRASALRVLSSIRVAMIAPIMLLAIKESVRDMSAYVRKVAAHAIPKLYALDPDLQPELIDCIDFLLGDKRTLVLGSAVYAFEETCPDRIDLLHRHYRALCRALADVDEWGQIVMLGLLTRYARSQFTAPEDDCSLNSTLDADHQLLLASARPLLQSRNCSAVMAVAQLFYHVAPANQLGVVAKALVRLLRGPTEVQHVVLVNVASICASDHYPNMFEPYLKSFFVRSSDPSHIKHLKLEVLTSLVSETNVQLVLRELQTYVQMSELAGPSIEAIGRCALKVGTVAESCLSGLIRLIANPSEQVVCSVVVVLKRLLHADADPKLLRRVMKLIHSVKAPSARACVVWLIATHIRTVPELAPDLLRIMTKSFCHEHELVKLQTINLAVRLWITDRERCELLVQYVMQLARFDHSYDVRDRIRFLRNFLGGDHAERLPMTDVFLVEKPSPSVQNQYRRDQFQLGTLSHLLNQKCVNYRELPAFAEEPSDSSLRQGPTDLVLATEAAPGPSRNRKADKQFYSEEDEDEEESSSDEDESEEEESSGEEEEDDAESSEEGDEESEEEGSTEEETEPARMQHLSVNAKTNGKVTKQPDVQKPKKEIPSPKNVDLLLDLNFDGVTINTNVSKHVRASAQYVDDEFLPALQIPGLEIKRRFTRSPSLFSNSMCAVELLVSLSDDFEFSEPLVIAPKKTEGVETGGTVSLFDFKKGQRKVMVGIDFGDCLRHSEWTVRFNGSEYSMRIEATLGEQIEAVEMKIDEFRELVDRLGGMQCHKQTINSNPARFNPRQLYKLANCKQVQGTKMSFASQTVSKKSPVLIVLNPKGSDEIQLSVHCENVVFGSMLSRYLEANIKS